jgi:hypothetical protein
MLRYNLLHQSKNKIYQTNCFGTLIHAFPTKKIFFKDLKL